MLLLMATLAAPQAATTPRHPFDLSPKVAIRRTMEQAAPAVHAGTIWAQTSTVSASAGSELAGVAAKHGLVYVDAPV